MLEIPRHARDVTASWVAGALSEAGVPTGSLRGVERASLNAGSGVFADVSRLRLTHERPVPGAPTTLIVKLQSEFPHNRARARLFRLYEREVRFYREIARALDLRVPRCYWSGLDPDSGRFALLLEDLGHLQTGGLLVGISPPRATLAVELLARAHAQWWDSPRLGGLAWMPSFGGPVMRQLAEVYRELWPAFVDLRGHTLPPGALTLGERVRDCFEELLDMLSRPPVTIAHADFRVDNLFFGDPGGPDAVAVIDWQLSSIGRGAFDVAYLLCQSMECTQRRRHEMSILRA